ncbi:MAG: PadR family transcriptional regulator [Longimicrobiales bacterium]|nr:PadR family transcriptional regulator [Longimicrobiales bacterium]
MGGRAYPGEFELVVLLASARLGSGAYGASIHKEILDTTGRDVSIPAVYVTLKRMEDKGLVTASMGVSDSDASRPTKNYRLTSEGRAAIDRSRALFERLWRDMEAPLGQGSGS